TVLSSISERYTRRPSGTDQSKVPLSKRKPAFNIRFLVVGGPYHSGYLKRKRRRFS
ncbi:hypothetical protein EDD85DRAFT_816195, partial [Armillaria nabsnona]